MASILAALLCASAALAHAHTQYYGGYTCEDGRDVIVHLFEWKWSDIETACPELASLGYCAVQVSPPQEHVIITDPPYPWWQRYQPVSYTVTSRSGDEAAFQSMVSACSAAGVKIYVDAIINHMTGAGSGTGSAGSFWDAGGEGGQNYPAVPYDESDFHGRDVCTTESMNVEDYQDEVQVRNCRLWGLRDLRIADTDVRGTLRAYLQELVDWGVAGFRIDAAKHALPEDIAAILNGLNPAPYIFQEVIDQGGEPITAGDYTAIGRVTEFKYGISLSEVLLNVNGQVLADLATFGESWGFLPSGDAVSFIDNHDNQRGHGTGGDLVTFKRPREYKMAVAFMLGWAYGHPRVMSSYAFLDDESDLGPPSDGNGNTSDVDCSSGEWICEHEWHEIANMVRFHNTVAGEPVANWWDNGANAVAFSRGSKGFMAINNERTSVMETFQTGLPAGEYCDVISCDGNSPPCGGAACGPSVVVDSSGFATITIEDGEAPVVAIHV